MKEALEFEWQLQDLGCDFEVLHTLQTALRDGGWQVTVAVYEGRDIIALWPGFHDGVFGMAVDVGSTTIAAHLCDLSSGEVVASAGVMNPQIRFGEDLMSRVSYVMMNPGGEVELTAAVRETLQALAVDVAEPAGISSEDILDVCVVGNPVMHHLLLGLNPVELGGAPFALATDEAVRVRGTDIGLALHPAARVYVLPCIARHVGADAAGVVLSEAPYLRDEMNLVVDVGTNAGNRSRQQAAHARLLQSHRPCLRGCANQLRPTGGARCPSNGCASIPRPWSRASR